MRWRVGILAALVGFGGACAPAAAPVPTISLEPIRVPPPGSGVLAGVSFLTGCWRSPSAASEVTLEERWTPPEGGVMLGTSRFIRDGRLASFEFGLIRSSGGAVELVPHPGGTRSPHPFVLTSSTPGEAVFEAPQHDYPKRIVYRRVADGLEARIDGGADDAEPRVWRMEPAACNQGL
jgi:hypothetical protein